MAPKYSWLFRWNEHYLTVPIHIKKYFTKRIGLFAGPCITWDIGYFRDFGISGGVSFRIGNSASIKLSVFTFSLADYYITYHYIPLGISYHYLLLKK